MNLKGCYSHETDHWATPREMYKYFTEKLGCIDPCPLHSTENNLKKIYKNKALYINPPYSQIDKWVEFIKRNIKEATIIFLLIPARTDTKYFHELLDLKPKITFIKGRLKFNDTGTAPFPSIILTFNKPYEDYNKINKEFFK